MKNTTKKEKAGLVIAIITIILFAIVTAVNIMVISDTSDSAFVALGWLITVAVGFIGWLPCILSTAFLHGKYKIAVVCVWVLYIALLLTGICNPIPQSV